MDRGDGGGLPVDSGIALFERLQDWLAADAAAHPERDADERFMVECSAIVLALCERCADMGDSEAAVRTAHMLSHKLMQGTARACNSRVLPPAVH